METSKRIGALIEDITRFLQNWFVYVFIFVFVASISSYTAGLAFGYWHNDKLEFGPTAVIEESFYEDGWKSLANNAENYDFYQSYYSDYYQPYIDQAETYPEPYKTDEIKKLEDLIKSGVEQNITPIDGDFLLRLMVSTFTPLFFWMMLVFFLRAPLADFRPFEKDETLHGDAKWATEKDIKGAGLRSKEGLLMGRDNRGFLVGPGYQHATLFAPTGSGKGVGFVIPNLLFWDESVFIHDIKLENFDLTSGFRRDALKQDVFLWAPADPDGHTHCYNPIDWVSKKPGQMVDDVQKIANLILPEQEFWNNEARSLFVGVTLYLLAVPEKVKSFGEVVRTLRSDDVVYNLAVVLDTIGKKIHPVSYMNIAAFLQKADKERSGVISTLNSGLELWANPLIDTATASSDFDVQQMKKRKTTVYVGLTPDNIQRLQPLLQVFYQQATEFLVRKIPDEKEDPYGVLFMMDEFPTLGEMKQFHAGIAYFRGYNVRLFLIVQDTQQLKGIYEEHGMNTFLSNSTYRITFAANNVETANLISQLIGNKTVKQKSMNKPKYLDLNPATRTIHESEIQRALLLPQEVIGLPRDEQIILIESTPPIKTKKVFYYKDNFFKKRLLDPIEIPTQEPYDARKVEEDKKKKEEEDKKKKKEAEEAAKKKKEVTKKPPPLPPLPDLPDTAALPKQPVASADNKPIENKPAAPNPEAAKAPPPPPPAPAPPAGAATAPPAPLPQQEAAQPAAAPSPQAPPTQPAPPKPEQPAAAPVAPTMPEQPAPAAAQPAAPKPTEAAPEIPPAPIGVNEGNLPPSSSQPAAAAPQPAPAQQPPAQPKPEENNDESSDAIDMSKPIPAVPKLDDLPDFPDLPPIPSKIDEAPKQGNSDNQSGFGKKPKDDSEDKKG